MTIIASLSPRRPGFDSSPIHVRFVIDRVALGQVFLRILQFLPVSIISLILHIHSEFNSPLLSERQVGKVWQPSNTAMLLRLSMWFGRKNISTFCLQVRWQDFFVRRFLVLVCQPNAACKLYLKILHLLHFIVSEMNSSSRADFIRCTIDACSYSARQDTSSQQHKVHHQESRSVGLCLQQYLLRRK